MNNSEELIVGVALADYNGNIFISLPKPFRHSHLYIGLNAINNSLPPVDQMNTFHHFQQGFITNAGKFLNRIEAKELGIKNGQYIVYDGKNNKRGYDNRNAKWAFSEDFWLD